MIMNLRTDFTRDETAGMSQADLETYNARLKKLEEDAQKKEDEYLGNLAKKMHDAYPAVTIEQPKEPKQ